MAAIVSLRDPQDRRPAELEALDVPILDLVFHDTDGDPLDLAPEEWHLVRLERFLDETRPSSLHIHCFAGVSRSPAVASFALAYLHPELAEAEVARVVLAVRPQALPNPHLLRLADGRLGRRLEEAWEGVTSRY